MAQGHVQNGASARKTFEIAIVGGGIAGLTLALALYHRGVPVKIYERAPRFGEIGAGVSFSPNAIQAMRHCHPGIYDAFEKVCTRNGWPSKEKVWFDYIDGTNDEAKEPAFTICTAVGQNGVHRAHFLDELVKLFPAERAIFGKELIGINESAEGKMVMAFADGSEASADAVIGCDGIKSRVRGIVVGSSHPSVHPTYTHKYAYRGMLSMEKAIEALGEERARNSCMHVSRALTGEFLQKSKVLMAPQMGQDGHVLTFPVSHGAKLNVVAFRTSSDDWDGEGTTKVATREDALRDFADFGKDVTNILKLTEEEPAVV